jgi:hypothetical protein
MKTGNKLSLIHCRSNESIESLVVTFLVPNCVTGMNTFGCLLSTHVGPMVHEVRASIVGKNKWKSLKLSAPQLLMENIIALVGQQTSVTVEYPKAENW